MSSDVVLNCLLDILVILVIFGSVAVVETLATATLDRESVALTEGYLYSPLTEPNTPLAADAAAGLMYDAYCRRFSS